MLTLEPRDTMRATMKTGEPFERRALGAVLALPIFLVLYVFLPPTASDIMEDFYEAKDRSESMIIDPLMDFPQVVKYHVIKDVGNRNMKFRGHAIEYLGYCKIHEALPLLLRILHDESEALEFRGDALESIFLIDAVQGTDLAKQYKGSGSYLGYSIRRILEEPDRILNHYLLHHGDGNGVERWYKYFNGP